MLIYSSVDNRYLVGRRGKTKHLAIRYLSCIHAGRIDIGLSIFNLTRLMILSDLINMIFKSHRQRDKTLIRLAERKSCFRYCQQILILEIISIELIRYNLTKKIQYKLIYLSLKSSNYFILFINLITKEIHISILHN